MLSSLSKLLLAKRYSRIETSQLNGEFQDDPLLAAKERSNHVLLNRVSQRGRATLIVAGVLLILLSALSFIAGALLFRATDASCTERLWTYSPMLRAVEYREVNLNNPFRKQTIYRGVPTPEGDKAWNKLWLQPSFNVPEAKVLALRYSADVTWRHTPQEFGGGIEGQAEVFHLLHCINMIRQYTYFDHYKEHNILPSGFNDTTGLLRTHVDHCLETLRLHIMCAGDVTLMPIKLDPTVKLGRSVEFSTRHMCRNFEALVDWNVANGIPSDRVLDD